jgi:radical SAM superfamily enzyme YgiQ (UPF0313 family)
MITDDEGSKMEPRLDKELSLAPGFLVTFAGPRIIRFPHLLGPAVGRAKPETLAFVDALSVARGRTVGSVIDELVREQDADRDLLVMFAMALDESGQLVEDPAPPRFVDTPVVPVDGATATAPDGPVRIVTPTSLVAEQGSYLWFDHGGTLRARLDLDEVRACVAFAVARPVDEAWVIQQRIAAPGLSREGFDDLVSRLAAGGLLVPAPRPARTPDANGGATPATPEVGVSRRQRVQEAVALAVDAHERRSAGLRGDRTPIVPVNLDDNVAPAGLGAIFAYAREIDGGRLQERYDFVPEFLSDEETLLVRAASPSIFLFSNYVWTIERNLAMSALVKQANPESITIHGGPSTPKYELDAELFFAEHPHVDVTVRNEGEATFAGVLDALEMGRPDAVDALRDVPGLTFRTSSGALVRTDERERITELDILPSPYLLGLFDPFGSAQSGAIIETNRGCPYGCTFCDWGSATLSRIRKFSLERVFAELEWSAQHQIDIASIADANFGIFERDVEIAQRIAELKREYGYPLTVAVNYAKNTVKHLRQIIEILADVEILTEGVVSLQSMDEPTLKIIRRSNIKLDKYNELSAEFRRSRLPLAADIMMGLPGSNPAAFRNDLQQCTDRDVRVRANPTQLLPNSPMNDPEYRAEHGITAKPGEILREAASFTRAEWDQMDRLRRAYYIFDNWGVLRYVARYVRRETGLHEVDFYDRVSSDAAADPATWPSIAAIVQLSETFMAPPGSWALFVDEVRRYLTDRLGLTDDTALETVLEVQLGHLPAVDRTFPLVLSLAHDYAAWQDSILAAREEGHRDDWESVVPRLAEYPPTELKIADPNDICRTDVGKPMGVLGLALRSWELDSRVARPRLGAMTTAT